MVFIVLIVYDFRNGTLCSRVEFYNGSDAVYQGPCSIKYNGTDGVEKEFYPFLAYTRATDIQVLPI